ncbi:uncharacterized protein LOC136037501 [Artemia franciscana]|uniref:uncharacterized protein LOC136037501 n=1 Tax=Artemia franciscana TaxID=6661 RepID=UPI0032DB3907
MYNRNDNAYGDERRRWNADDRYTQSSRYQDTGISSGLRGNDYQSRQSLMSTNYDDIRYFNANSGRVALLQENEMRRQETLERRSDSYGSGGQYGGFRVRGDRPRKSVYDEGPYHRQETERYPPRREEPLRGRGLLGEPEQQFLRPQPNMVHQMESEAKLALANTLINALVQSQQQPVLPTPAPWMAQPLMNASLFGGGVRGRRDEPRYRRDEARGYGQKMTRKVVFTIFPVVYLYFSLYLFFFSILYPQHFLEFIVFLKKAL